MSKPWNLSDLSEATRARNADKLPTAPVTLKRRKGRPEGELQDAVIKLAQTQGWLVAHFRPAQNSRGEWRTPVAADGAGFPDLILLRAHRCVVAELKTERNTLSAEQDKWHRAFLDAGCQVYIWRPNSWAEIERVLQ